MPPDEQTAREPPREAQGFVTTDWSAVLGAREAHSPQAAQALERLCRTYWYPLYAFVRRRGFDAHTSQDLVQEFFARLLAANFLKNVTAEKGRFRSFLLASFNHFLANEYDRARAQKRGAGQSPISLDGAMAEGMFALEPVCELTPEKVFEQRWAATLLDQAFARLRDEYAQANKQELFNELNAFLTEDAASGDYGPVAERLKMAPGAVAVAVHRLRRQYRECVRAEVANTVGSLVELEDEMRHLFAVLSQ